MDQNQSNNLNKSGISQTKKRNYWLSGSLFLVAAAMIAYFTFGTKSISLSTSANSKISEQLSFFPVFEPKIKYDFVLDTFHVSEDKIKPNQFLSEILDDNHVDYQTIDELQRNTADVFDVRKLRAGKPYMILSKDAESPADYFIYEPNVYRYVVYDIKNKSAKVVEREIKTEIRTASGIIESSLWQTMVDNNLSYDLASRLEDVFGWSIDFHHIQNGDRFKVIYEQDFIDDTPVGAGKILAGYYKNLDHEYYGIHFENEKHNGHYDLEARPMKKNFLKSPVKYSRISSRFNRNRFHPVLKRRKAHLGTDYAAPYGTPILAVANGVVTKRSRTRGNGNFVKIKHDATYQTQYLHMQKFAKGVTPGVHVKQGQVIGYVGSTGLATGPHVCFRFWKNGRQVNHLRLNFPPPEPMPKDDIPKFNELKDKLLKQLAQIEYQPKKELVSAVDVKEKKEGKKSNP